MTLYAGRSPALSSLVCSELASVLSSVYDTSIIENTMTNSATVSPTPKTIR